MYRRESSSSSDQGLGGLKMRGRRRKCQLVFVRGLGRNGLLVLFLIFISFLPVSGGRRTYTVASAIFASAAKSSTKLRMRGTIVTGGYISFHSTSLSRISIVLK